MRALLRVLRPYNRHTIGTTGKIGIIPNDNPTIAIKHEARHIVSESGSHDPRTLMVA